MKECETGEAKQDEQCPLDLALELSLTLASMPLEAAGVAAGLQGVEE